MEKKIRNILYATGIVITALVSGLYSYHRGKQDQLGQTKSKIESLSKAFVDKSNNCPCIPLTARRAFSAYADNLDVLVDNINSTENTQVIREMERNLLGPESHLP